MKKDNEIKPFFRIILCKDDSMENWSIVNNPKFDLETKSLHTILLNDVNKYAETKNCGVRYRMIRVSDYEKYGFKLDELKKEWTLDPRTEEV